MGLGDKIENSAKDVVGNAKEGLGNLTNNEELKAEGVKDQVAAKAGQVGENVKDAVSDAGDAIKSAGEGNN